MNSSPRRIRSNLSSSDDPRVLFEPRPDFSGFSEGTWVTTNSRGLRERELPADETGRHPPGGVPGRLGDVWAGVRDDEAFPRLLEASVNGGGGRPNRGRQYRRGRLQLDAGAGETGTGGAGLPAGSGGADVRGERSAGDVLTSTTSTSRPACWPAPRSGSAGTATSTVSSRMCTGGLGRRSAVPVKARPSRSGSAIGWRSGWRRLARWSGHLGRTARASCWSSTPTT